MKLSFSNGGSVIFILFVHKKHSFCQQLKVCNYGIIAAKVLKNRSNDYNAFSL